MKPALATVIMLLLLASVLFMGSRSHRSYEHPDAWTIIRQPTNDHFRINNYGYVADYGSWILGFTNKESAVKAMKESRWHSRHPPKPVKPRKAIDEWRVD